MSGFFRMEIKVVSRLGKRSDGTYGVNDSIHAAAYIDGQRYERNASSAAAYISGSSLTIENGKEYDYRRKQGIETSFVLLPENAPQEYINPQVLWDAVETMETASNADLFREWIICFDKHLTYEERLAVAKEFAESLAEEGMAVHVALHSEKDGNGNFHMHALSPTRGFNEDGSWQEYKTLPRRYALDEAGNKIPVIDKKTGEQKVDQYGRPYWKREPIEYVNSWNDRRAGNAQRWRKVFCEIENKYLSPENQVSPKSYREQGIDRLPGKHLGKIAFNVHRKMAAKVKGLTPEVRKEYLERIDDLLSRKNNTPEWQAEHDALQAELQASLKEVSKYSPKKEQVKNFSEKRVQVQLEEAFSAVYQYQRSQYTEDVQQEVAEQSFAVVEKILQAAEDLLLMESGVLTQPMEQRLLQGEFNLKKALLKETEKEIAQIEKQIAELKERGEDAYGREIEQLLAQYRETLQRTGTVEPSGTAEPENLADGDGIVGTANRVSKLSAELRRHHRDLEEAGRRVAEITGRENKSRAQRTQKGIGR